MDMLATLKSDKTSVKYNNWLEIDLGALAQNYRTIKDALTPATEVLAVVKANAYGHGVIKVVETAISEGISFFGVANIAEAVELRCRFSEINILVLNSNFSSDVELIVEHDIQPIVYTKEMLYAINQEAKLHDKKVKVHIKIDTGMGRIGVSYKKAYSFIKNALDLENIKIEGICSHFSSAGNNFSYSLKQWEAFSRVIEQLDDEGIVFPYYHMSNSSGTFVSGLPYFNLVRIGILTYGLLPKEDIKPDFDLRPVMSWRGKVIYCKNVKSGQSISYGCTHIVSSDTKIATVPVGYADGYMRSLSNKGFVLVGGRRCPVVGTVTMDQIMVDVGLDSDVSVGDEVTIIGSQAGERISFEELSNSAGTISYELACNAGRRANRFYFYS